MIWISTISQKLRSLIRLITVVEFAMSHTGKTRVMHMQMCHVAFIQTNIRSNTDELNPYCARLRTPFPQDMFDVRKGSRGLGGVGDLSQFDAPENADIITSRTLRLRRTISQPCNLRLVGLSSSLDRYLLIRKLSFSDLLC